MNIPASNQLSNHTDLDRQVLVAMKRKDDFDAYGFPITPAVKRITKAIGRDPEDQGDVTDVYYSMKFLAVLDPSVKLTNL